MLYAKVTFGLGVSGPFDYLVPQEFSKNISPGMRVLVDFRNKKETGYIVSLSRISSVSKVKPILKVLDNFAIIDELMLLLFSKASVYYCCSIGQIIESAIPARLRNTKGLNLDLSPIPEIKKDAPVKRLLFDRQALEGRWEFYLKNIKEQLVKNLGTILIFADIQTATQAQIKLKNQLGIDIALLLRNHPSELSQWAILKSAKSMVAVGTRSAIFAPVNNLGLIIIDEEENDVYKQEQVPHYHARKIAFMRSEIEHANLLLGSCAPSLQSIFEARGKQLLPETINRVNKFPAIRLSPYYYKDIFSKHLLNSIYTSLENKEKVFIFLNRKGFATSAACNNCGQAVKCPRCSMNLVFHQKDNQLICRYCNFKTDNQSICPHCKKGYLKYCGFGTEKIASELSRIFPAAKIMALEEVAADNISTADIFISTNRINKYHNFNFGLVGVIAIDDILNRPELDASVKAFGILLKLSCLTEKEIIIQTNLITHRCFAALIKNDPDLFYDAELLDRKQLKFPPYTHLAEIRLRGKNEAKVNIAAEKLADLFKATGSKPEILSVNPANPYKLRDNFYWCILLKSASAEKLVNFIKNVLKDFSSSGIIVSVDIDPI